MIGYAHDFFLFRYSNLSNFNLAEAVFQNKDNLPFIANKKAADYSPPPPGLI
jgi:hypothetical protein